MKTKDWIAHPRSKSKKELGDQVTGRWKVNLFFLLLVTSQSLILPWLPAILQASGLGGTGIGVAMALITFASVLSVKIVLVFITATKSGALRRFVLIFLLCGACVMYVLAIAALPSDKSYNHCSSDSPPAGDAHGSNVTMPITLVNEDPTSTMETPATKSPLIAENARNSSTVEANANSLTSKSTLLTNTSPQIPSSKTNPTTTSTTSTSTISTSTTTSSTTSTTAATPTTTLFTTKMISNLNGGSSGIPSLTESPANELSSDRFTFNLNTENSIIPVTEESTEGLLAEEGNNPSGNKNQEFSHPLDTRENVSSLSQRIPEKFGTSLPERELSSGITGNHAWFSKTPSLSSAVQPQFAPLSSQERSRKYGSQFHNFHDLSSFSDDIYNQISQYHKHGPSYQSNVIKGEDINAVNYESVDLYRPKNYKHFIVKRDNVQHKKAVSNGEKVQENTVKNTNLGQKLDEELTGGDSFDLDAKNIEKFKQLLMETEAKSDATEPPETSYEPRSWIWVSILLVSATLLAGGIEAGVTRLWHCYSHCYHLFHNRPRQDVNSDDLLERTLTDTFELSANGEHYGWTRILSGCVILTSAMLLAFGCQIGLPPGWSLVGQAGVFTIGNVFTFMTLLLLLPVPWGSIKPPKMARPLSLYLDDEVLWEGLRRIACPLGTAVHGLLSSLPSVYVVLLLLNRSDDPRFGSALSVLGVSFSMFGEGLTMCCRRKLTSILDSPGLVGLSLGSLAAQLMLVYFVKHDTAQWLVAVSWVLVGAGHSLIIMSVRQNALMLATIRDQEREAWVSWVSGKVGTALGAFIWPFVSMMKWGSVTHLQLLLMPTAATSAVISVSVAVLAALTRSRRAARRRVYHTLDLHSTADADDEDSDEEEDWLVRGARKEGMLL